MEKDQGSEVDDQMLELLLYMQHLKGGNCGDARRIAEESRKKNIIISTH